MQVCTHYKQDILLLGSIVQQYTGCDPMGGKCSIRYCRKEKEITLPDGRGLCWEHWEKHCEE